MGRMMEPTKMQADSSSTPTPWPAIIGTKKARQDQQCLTSWSRLWIMLSVSVFVQGFPPMDAFAPSLHVPRWLPRRASAQQHRSRAELQTLGLRASGGGSVLRVKDAASGTSVVLIGTMHGNPASCSLTSSVVRQEAPRAVLVELCPARWNITAAAEWNATAASLRPFSFRRWIYRDEFQTAFEAARSCGLADVELVDQPIGNTTRRLRALFAQSLSEIAAGPSGWRALSSDIARGLRALNSSDGGLGAGRALLDPALIAGTPVALFRGPVCANMFFVCMRVHVRVHLYNL